MGKIKDETFYLEGSREYVFDNVSQGASVSVGIEKVDRRGLAIHPGRVVLTLTHEGKAISADVDRQTAGIIHQHCDRLLTLTGETE